MEAVKFTASQEDAIQYRGLDACVEAGPGSGKTTVLVERYRRLLEESKFEVRQILAITFTEKAAANMKSRLADKFREDTERLRELETGWVSTIHGFCARLLKENAIAAGIDPRFGVLDAREAEDLQVACMHAAMDELVETRRTEALALIAALQSPGTLARELKNVWDAMRSAGVTGAEMAVRPSPLVNVPAPAELARRVREWLQGWPPAVKKPVDHLGEIADWSEALAAADPNSLESIRQVAEHCPVKLNRIPDSCRAEIRKLRDEDLPELLRGAIDRHTAPFRALVFQILMRFETLYAERKTATGALDFNDLERRSIELLRRDTTVRQRVRAQFRQIMLDEFQDINEQQAELIRLIRNDDVFFAVGDVNQSIYGFRHAQPAIFNRYREEARQAGKQVTQLHENFRSRAEILSSVEALLNSAQGIEARQLTACREFAGVSSPAVEVWCARAAESEEAAMREAKWIAHRILELRGQPEMERFGDFAILCRNSESMGPILEALDNARIPYVCGRRQSFLLSREGRDMRALLRVMANPRDSVALGTVLRSGLVSLSDEALLRLRLDGGSLPGGLKALAAELDAEDAVRLDRFNANLKRWRAARGILPLDVLLTQALTDCGFGWDPRTVDGANVEAFLQLARTRGGFRSLPGFLMELESVEEAVNTESDLSDADQGDCVQVMTAHGAKGLEFPVTIIAAMNKETQRSTGSVTFTAEHGVGMRWADASGRGTKDAWANANSESLKQREEEEASRLLYVAMTRAEQRLILSYSATKPTVAGWAKRVATHFGKAVREVENDPPSRRADAIGTTEALPVLLRPVVTDQHDTAVSVTSLALFAKCPRKYYIERYAGWGSAGVRSFDPEMVVADEAGGESAGQDAPAAELGSMVHDLLARKPGEYAPDAVALANVFRESDLGRRAAHAVRSEREWDFIVALSGTVVRGSIDLWFEEKGGLVLVDYKTDAAPVSPEDYAPQLAVYALALEQALGVRPAYAYLHFLRLNRVVEVPLEHARESVRTLVEDLKQSQEALRFDLRPGEQCKRCAYYGSVCPAGQEARAAGQ